MWQNGRMERSSFPGLDVMAVFLAVVECGSLTKAAQRLGVFKSTVSRQVSALEERLGVSLLHRTTRQLRLTEAGQRYHASCVRVVAEARAAEEELREEQQSPRGTLRVSAPPLLAELLLGPVLAPYLARYPGMQVEVVTSWTGVDVRAQGFDLALLVGPQVDSTLRTRVLGTARVAYCASPAYLREHGAPRTPEELSAHACVALFDGEPRIAWPFSAPRGGVRWVPVSARLSANTFALVHQAVLAGVGLGRFPQPVVAEDIAAGRLREVLLDWLPPTFPVHAVYMGGRGAPPKVQAFLALLTGFLQSHPERLGTPGARRAAKG